MIMNKPFESAPARARSVSKQLVCTAAVAALLSMFAVSASAQIEPPRQKVEFNDLDLTKDQDTQRLYRRLRTAASEVCAQFNGYRNAQMRALRAECINNALTGAVETIGNESLTALHTKRNAGTMARREPKPASAS